MNKQMNKHAMGYLLAVVVVVALLIAVVPGMLGGEDPGGGRPEEQAQPQETVPERPGCAALGVAGVELGCLGAEAEADAPRELSDGAVTVVNVWAWWCAPCREELPLMQRLAAEHPEYRVVGVHADPQAARGAVLLEDLGLDLPSFQDSDNAFAAALGLPGVVPVTLVVVDGEVRSVLPKPYADMEELERDVREAAA